VYSADDDIFHPRNRTYRLLDFTYLCMRHFQFGKHTRACKKMEYKVVKKYFKDSGWDGKFHAQLAWSHQKTIQYKASASESAYACYGRHKKSLRPCTTLSSPHSGGKIIGPWWPNVSVLGLMCVGHVFVPHWMLWNFHDVNVCINCLYWCECMKYGSMNVVECRFFVLFIRNSNQNGR
jgi:hypothetical protein